MGHWVTFSGQSPWVTLRSCRAPGHMMPMLWGPGKVPLAQGEKMGEETTAEGRPGCNQD